MRRVDDHQPFGNRQGGFTDRKIIKNPMALCTDHADDPGALICQPLIECLVQTDEIAQQRRFELRQGVGVQGWPMQGVDHVDGHACIVQRQMMTFDPYRVIADMAQTVLNVVNDLP